MDSMRGGFHDLAGGPDWMEDDTLDLTGFEADEDIAKPAKADIEALPPAIGQDERRMQVRAYNLWAELLANRSFPDIDDLDAASNRDFGDYSVLLDFSAGIDDPLVVHLGRKLAEECYATNRQYIGQLSDVPVGSLLSRITDHYIQILARQSPIGFEAEFVNRHGKLIVYRGILLPFSSDDVNIDHIYGVLNWKEVAEPAVAESLARELQDAVASGDDDSERNDETLPAPLSRRLRAMTPRGFDTLNETGPEFTLLMARRLGSGNVTLLGEVPFDPMLLKRAADRFEDR